MAAMRFTNGHLSTLIKVVHVELLVIVNLNCQCFARVCSLTVFYIFGTVKCSMLSFIEVGRDD